MLSLLQLPTYMRTVQKRMYSAFSMLMVSLLAVALSSCGSAIEERVAMIPASSTAVFSMDIGQMGKKAVNFSDLFNTFSDNEEMEEMFEQIENSGIDFNEEMYIYVNTKTGMDAAGGIIIPLTDADDFMAFLRDMSVKMGSDFMKESTDGINHAELADGSALVLWDDKTALITNKSLVFNEDRDGQLEDALDLFMNGADDKLASDSDEFQELMEAGHDMSFFANYEKLAPMAMMINPMMAQTGIKEMKAAIGIDFEDGEIVMDMMAYYDKSAGRFMEVIKGEIDDDVLEDISSASPIGVAAMALNMDAMYDLLDDMGLLEEMEREMKQEGVVLEDLMKAFTGDFAIVLNGMDMKRPSRAPETYRSSESDLRLVASVGVEDAEEVESMLDKLVEKGDFIKDGQTYMDKDMEMYIQLEDDRLLISDAGSRDDIVNGSLGNLPGYMGDLVEDYPSAFAMDMENMPESVLASMLEDLPKSTRGWFMDEFPILNMVAYAEFPKDRKGHSVMTIKTRDSGENSLRTIMEFVKKVADAEEQERNYNSGVEFDVM